VTIFLNPNNPFLQLFPPAREAMAAQTINLTTPTRRNTFGALRGFNEAIRFIHICTRTFQLDVILVEFIHLENIRCNFPLFSRLSIQSSSATSTFPRVHCQRFMYIYYTTCRTNRARSCHCGHGKLKSRLPPPRTKSRNKFDQSAGARINTDQSALGNHIKRRFFFNKRRISNKEIISKL